MCFKCGGTLRGLDPHGRCPSCGASVAESTAVDGRWPVGLPRSCLNCGYSLRGLAETGSCPECGWTYSRPLVPPYYPKPPAGGWLALFYPPIVAVLGPMVLGAVLPLPISCGIVLIFVVACASWASIIVEQFAAWRCHRRLVAAEAGTVRWPGLGYERKLMLWLFLMELVLILGPWIAFALSPVMS